MKNKKYIALTGIVNGKQIRHIFRDKKNCDLFVSKMNPSKVKLTVCQSLVEAAEHLGLAIECRENAKCFAVAKGYETGIYPAYEIALAQTEHYAGASMKKFANLEGAKVWLSSYNIRKPRIFSATAKPDTKKPKKIDEFGDIAIAYTDGSHDPKTHKWGYGIVLHDATDSYNIFRYSGSGIMFRNQANITGEIMAAYEGVSAAVKMGYKAVIIRYDSTSVVNYLTSQRKANNLAEWYEREMSKLMKTITVCFEKVKAHSGNAYNNIADTLARQAIGIG